MGESTKGVTDHPGCMGGAYCLDMAAGSIVKGNAGVVDLDLGSCFTMRSSCGSNVLSRRAYRRLERATGAGVWRAVVEAE